MASNAVRMAAVNNAMTKLTTVCSVPSCSSSGANAAPRPSATAKYAHKINFDDDSSSTQSAAIDVAMSLSYILIVIIPRRMMFLIVASMMAFASSHPSFALDGFVPLLSS